MKPDAIEPAISAFEKHGLAGLVILALFILLGGVLHFSRKDRHEYQKHMLDIVKNNNEAQKDSADKISSSVDRNSKVIDELKTAILLQRK